MTAALMLIALGMLALIVCRGWWRNPDDLILTGLRKAAAVVSTLFAKDAPRV